MKILILIFFMLSCNTISGQVVQLDSTNSVIKNNTKSETVKIPVIINSRDNTDIGELKRKKKIKRVIGISSIYLGSILGGIAYSSKKIPPTFTTPLLVTGFAILTGGIITLSIPIRKKKSLNLKL